jgi:hypothetical protein
VHGCDRDVLFGHDTVDDSVGPELHRALTIPVLIEHGACADEHVVGVGLARQADVGAARVGLGGGVGVVDDHRLLVAGVHVLVEREQLAGVELVEGGAARGVDHRDEALGAVAALRARHHAARLVGMVPFGVRHDGVVRLLGDGQHASRVGRAVDAARTRLTS